MYCPTCGTENPKGSKFCEKCGANLAEENFNESNEESEVEYTGFFIRAVAYIVDLIILAIVNFIIKAIIGRTDLYYALTVIIPLIYFVIMESSKTQGSLGKMLLKIKVVNEAGDKMSVLKAIIRYLAFEIFSIVSSLLAIADGSNYIDPKNIDQVMKAAGNASHIIGYIGLIYDLILLITILASEYKQGVHDRVTKTYVVNK